MTLRWLPRLPRPPRTSGPSTAAAAAAALVALAVASGVAAADPAFDRFEKALPAGWSLLATGSELVLRHDRPSYVTHHRAAGTASATATAGARAATPPGGGPLVTIELRYRLEPRWSAQQLAEAKATNDQIDVQLRALTAQYRIDAIPKANGQPLPANADDRARLSAYEAARAPLLARRTKLPHCNLGDASVFDGDDTYAQLSLDVDPPSVMTQAHHILELMKQYCN